MRPVLAVAVEHVRRMREREVRERERESRVPPDLLERRELVPHPCELPLVQEIVRRGVPLISELELGYQHTICLNIAITGTNGKTTTTELVERTLEAVEDS